MKYCNVQQIFLEDNNMSTLKLTVQETESWLVEQSWESVPEFLDGYHKNMTYDKNENIIKNHSWLCKCIFSSKSFLLSYCETYCECIYI